MVTKLPKPAEPHYAEPDEFYEFKEFLEKEFSPADHEFEKYLNKDFDPLYEFQKYLEKEHVPMQEFEEFLEKDFAPAKVRRAVEHLGIRLLTRNPYIQFGFDLADLALHEFGPDWMTTHTEQGEWEFNWEDNPRHYVSCFNAGVPIDIGFGTGSSSWTGCPGGSCDGSFVNVSSETFTGNHAIKTSSVHTGGGFWTHYSFMWGPMNGTIDRFGLREKICAPATTYEPTWNRDVSPRYLIGEKHDKRTTMPLPDALNPPRPWFQHNQPGPDRREKKRRKRYMRPMVETVVSGLDAPWWYAEPKLKEHPKKPPNDKWTREKKTDPLRPPPMWMVRKMITKLYDATTEAKDIVDSFYDALPRDHRCPGAKSMSDKAYCVWQNIEYIDIDKLIYNLIKNEIEDKIVGRFVGKVGKHTPYGTIGQGMKAPPVPRWVFAG